jgi:hypothetical protein
MHDALGDSLAVEVADLLEELVVLERRRPAIADRALVLVVVDRMSLARREDVAVVPFGGRLARHVGHVVSSRSGASGAGPYQSGMIPCSGSFNTFAP